MCVSVCAQMPSAHKNASCLLCIMVGACGSTLSTVILYEH